MNEEKARALRRGLVSRAFSPCANHQFYGWFWFNYEWIVFIKLSVHSVLLINIYRENVKFVLIRSTVIYIETVRIITKNNSVSLIYQIIVIIFKLISYYCLIIYQFKCYNTIITLCFICKICGNCIDISIFVNRKTT